MTEKNSTVEKVSFKGYGKGICENDFNEEQMDILHQLMIIGGTVNQEDGEGKQYMNTKICQLQNYLLSHPEFDCKKVRKDILFLNIVDGQAFSGKLSESIELVKEYGISIYPEPTYFTW